MSATEIRRGPGRPPGGDPANAERDACIVAMVQEGGTYEATGRLFGITRERARQIVVRDAPGWYRARRAAWTAKHVCECGAPKEPNSRHCRECWAWAERERRLTHPGRLWTREAVIGAFHAWVEIYGAPPSAADWSPAMARRTGRPDRAERFEVDGCWPHVNTVQARFGGWNAGLTAAGLPTRRTGQHGPRLPPVRPLLAIHTEAEGAPTGPAPGGRPAAAQGR